MMNATGAARGVRAGLAVLVLTAGGAAWGKGEKAAERKKMNVVFAIDVSGSMEHIIAATQKKVWAIVNDLMKAKPLPDLRIGLIAYRGEREECYGRTGLKVWDLSDDLDTVYKHLMELRTGGGDIECVGRAIHDATHKMSWDEGRDVLKTVFVLGNEPANQDTNQKKYGYKVTAPQAIAAGIVVNTVFCGNEGGREAGWEEIARMTDGVYTTIGLEGRVVAIATPMDKDLAELNVQLNATYVAFGKEGADRGKAQASMDAAAVGHGESVLAERAMAKVSGGYRNAGWDLVDALETDKDALKKAKDEDLPEVMQKLTPDQRVAFVENKRKEREGLQQKMAKLGQQRDAFIQEELKKKGGAKDAFDQVIQEALRKQAQKKGFSF